MTVENNNVFFMLTTDLCLWLAYKRLVEHCLRVIADGYTSIRGGGFLFICVNTHSGRP